MEDDIHLLKSKRSNIAKDISALETSIEEYSDRAETERNISLLSQSQADNRKEDERGHRNTY